MNFLKDVLVTKKHHNFKSVHFECNGRKVDFFHLVKIFKFVYFYSFS